MKALYTHTRAHVQADFRPVLIARTGVCTRQRILIVETGIDLRSGRARGSLFTTGCTDARPLARNTATKSRGASSYPHPFPKRTKASA